MYAPTEIQEYKDQQKLLRRRKRKDKFYAWVICLAALVFALWPMWCFGFLYHILHPSSFVEKFVTISAGIFFGGTIQVFMLIFWAMFTSEMTK